MDRAKKAWAEKQNQWAEDAEKEEAEKAVKAKFRVNLEDLLDRFVMQDLKSFCKEVLGTLPPTEPRYVVFPFPIPYGSMVQLFRNELNTAMKRNTICV